MEFIAATNNAHKLAEMRRILVRMGHTVLSQREAGVLLEPEETGTTFEENAAIKAQAICEACQKPTIADDSGLCVDALDGAPGVYSARYAGVPGGDGAHHRKLPPALQGVPAAHRTAPFTRMKSPGRIPFCKAPQLPIRIMFLTPILTSSSTAMAAEAPPIPVDTAMTGTPL